MLELENVTKVFHQGRLTRSSFKVLDGVSFRLEKGEIVGITGESGSGKTTLARIALRLMDPTSGSIFLDDADITHMSMRQLRPLRGRMQIVFQHPEGALDPEMRIRDSVREALMMSGTPKNAVRERMMDACSEVNLPAELLDRYPSQVSGGEVQRAVLARVMSFHPEYLFLDEPTSMLDVSVQAFILDFIRARARKDGTGIALITHDIDIIRCMCSKAVVLSEGGIVDSGDVTCVLNGGQDRPSSSMVRLWDSQMELIDLA